MASGSYWSRLRPRFTPHDSTTVLLVLAVFVGSLAPLPALFDPVVAVVRVGLGLVLLTLAPGVLVVNLLDLRIDQFGRYLVIAVGLSLPLVTVLALATNAVLSALGVSNPLSVGPLALALTALLVVLVALSWSSGNHDIRTPRFLVEPTAAASALVGIVPLAVLAAASVRAFDVYIPMYAFVASVLVVVALTATRRVPSTLYPLAVYAVAAGTFLHRNLVSGFLVGADVQALYGTAQLLVDSQQWATTTAGSPLAVPTVTLTPATTSILTGLDLATVFTVVNVLVFAFVPLGLYYVARDLFSPDVAVFGSFFFVFYHVSFSFSPGKQLLAGLFVILILDTLTRQWARRRNRLFVVGVLSLGLVFTHYATTYVFALALLLGGIGLGVFARLVDDTDIDATLPVTYGVGMLSVGSAWYWYVSRDLFADLVSAPLVVFDQVLVLLSAGTVPGSGTSFASQDPSLLEQAQVGVYFLCTALLVVGIVAVLVAVHRRRRVPGRDSRAGIGTRPGLETYVAVALPLFAFLVSSYFFVFNLWADRVYQMVLVVLAPLLPVGCLAVSRLGKSLVPSRLSVTRPRWAGVVVILVALFALNSGFAFALTGAADTSTFNENANDLAFNDGERAAVDWLAENADIVRADEYRSTGSLVTVDAPEQTQIYTDSQSYQLFRAKLPSGRYTSEVVVLKNRWKPRFDPANVGPGYVFIRHDAVRTVDSDRPAPPSVVAADAREAILGRGTVVYRNDDVTIVHIPGSDGG